MKEITVIDHAISKTHKSAYVIDWSLTYLCNLDCSYCDSHDNSTKHPDKNECKKAIDFALEYADITLSVKKKFERAVSFNILGGEPMIHPDFPEILEHLNNVYNSKYKSRWPITVYLITNGIVGKNTLQKCLPYIDYITVSYHTETNQKQKQMCIESIYTIHETGRPLDVRLMAHSNTENFNECKELASKLEKDGIRFQYKPIGICSSCQLDWTENTKLRHFYNQDQTETIIKFYNSRTTNSLQIDDMVKVDDRYVVASAGGPCCSEKPLVVNFDRKNPVNLIPNKNFQGWYCSVNWQFLYIDQNSGKVFHNTSCNVNYDNEVGPIGYLSNPQEMINKLQNMIDNKQVNVIQCPKTICGCGICAPKAKRREDFEIIMTERMDSTILHY